MPEVNKEDSQPGIPGATDGGDPNVDPQTGEAVQDKPADHGQPQEIRVGNRVFKSTDELIQEYQDAQTLIGKQGHELGELRSKAKEQVPKTPAPNQTEDDEESLLWTDPKAWKKRTQDEVKQELELKYQWDKMWDKFYRENPDLDGDDEREIVSSSYNRLYSDVKELSTNKALEKIAEHARGRIASFAKKGERVATVLASSNASAISGGSGNNDTPAPSKEPEVKVLSLSEQIRAGRRKKA